MKDETMEYEIAMSSAMAEEAAVVLKGFKTWLIKKYGSNVRNHFIDSNYKKEKTWKTMPQKRNISKMEDWDDDVGNFLQDTNTDDKISRVLIEGMEQLAQQEKQDKAGEKDNGNEQTNRANNNNEKKAEAAKEVIEIEEVNKTEENNKSGNENDTVT